MSVADGGLSARLLRALAVNNKAKLNFPGVFMGLTGKALDNDEVELEFDDGALFRDGQGELNWPTLGVVLDIALGSVTRIKSGPTMRPATVQLQIHMTGAPAQGPLVTRASFVGFSERTALRHALSTGSLSAGDTVIAHASGEFVMLDLPAGTTQAPMPWAETRIDAVPQKIRELDANDRAALRICRRAEAAATAEQPFIEHFWCGIPQASEGRARLAVKVTPHLGNRVGQVHGGLLLGLAARVAGAAVPGTMRLSNISTWFISPGQAPSLSVRSAVVQQGRNLAVVRTQIKSATGKLVLEATSQHVAVTASAA